RAPELGDINYLRLVDDHDRPARRDRRDQEDKADRRREPARSRARRMGMFVERLMHRGRSVVGWSLSLRKVFSGPLSPCGRGLGRGVRGTAKILGFYLYLCGCLVQRGSGIHIQDVPDRFQNSLRFFKTLMVPESQDAKSL